MPGIVQMRYQLLMLHLFSTILRLTVQCGNPLGTSYLIYVNGVNLVNYTVPAPLTSFIPDQFQVNVSSSIMTFYSLEFRYNQSWDIALLNRS